VQTERPYPRDPVTGIIRGAEAFEFGAGSHAVLFLHGWTSTPREMRFLAEKVAAAGFRCSGPLLKGHGRTLPDLAGTRFADYLSECEAAFDSLSASHGRVSVCGLSMGGLLGLYLAVRRPVANLILIAPFLRPYGKTLGLPNSWLAGRVPLAGNLAKYAPGPIRDQESLRSHIAYHAMPARSMGSVVAAGRKIAANADQIHCPVLILHSVHDTTSDFSGSRLLIEKLGSDDKTLVALNRSNHVVTLDFDRARVEETTVSWLERRRSAIAGS
jgi:carboxylesterase